MAPTKNTKNIFASVFYIFPPNSECLVKYKNTLKRPVKAPPCRPQGMRKNAEICKKKKSQEVN